MSNQRLDISVLYVEDDKATRDEIFSMLQRRASHVLEAADGIEGLELFISHRPDIVITDIRMPRMDGLQMAKEIGERSPGTPIIVTTAHGDVDYLLQAIDIAVDQYILKPVDTRKLLKALEKGAHMVLLEKEIRTRESEREALVLELEKEKGFLRSLFDALPCMLFIVDNDVRVAHMNKSAYAAVGQAPGEYISARGGDILRCVHAVDAPEGCGGSPHCRECIIRNSVKSAYAGNAVYNEEYAMQLQGSPHVADAFFNVVTLPMDYAGNRYVLLYLEDITKLKQNEAELCRANQLLEHQATTDPLTGIYNRLKFDDVLRREISRARRHHLPTSLIMFDIDYFKAINDSYGHHLGDVVLQKLTARVAQHLRQYDYFARWGGEEFMILLTHNTLETTVLLAEKIRVSVESLTIGGLQGITCSFGVTQLHRTDDLFTVTKRVDEALYKAKAAGRNCVAAL